MYEKFIEQAGTFFKPMGDLMSLNVEALEAISEKQTTLISEMWSDSINHLQGLADQRDLEAIYATQMAYLEGISDKVNATTRDSMDLLTQMQERMGAVWQESLVTEAGEPTLKSLAGMGSNGRADASSSKAKAASSVKKATDQAAKTADSVTKSTGQAAKKTAEQTTKATEQAAKSAEHVTKKTTESAKKATDQATRAASESESKKSAAADTKEAARKH